MHICILTADYIKRSLKKEDKISLNAGQKDCRMLPGIRISRKGVNMYKGVGALFADFFYFF